MFTTADLIAEVQKLPPNDPAVLNVGDWYAEVVGVLHDPEHYASGGPVASLQYVPRS